MEMPVNTAKNKVFYQIIIFLQTFYMTHLNNVLDNGNDVNMTMNFTNNIRPGSLPFRFVDCTHTAAEATPCTN